MLRPGFAEFAHVIKYQGQGAVSAGESRVNADCSAESIDRFFRPAAHCESGAEIVVGPGFFRFGKRGISEDGNGSIPVAQHLERDAEPVQRIDVIRPHAECMAVSHDRIKQLIGIPEGLAKLAISFGVIRLRANRIAKCLDGIIQLIFFLA